MTTNNSTLVGTAGGTFLCIVPNLTSADVMKTMILAALGAVVSFMISILLKWIYWKRRK
jgi:hypothetical protein